jgi:nucleoside-diphosphate-sugar epimerase
MSAYLVTGASGFLGRHLLEAITAQDPDARRVALVRDPSALAAQSWFAELGAIDLLRGDLAALPSLAQDPLLADLTGIYHCAAEVHHGRDHSEHQLAINIGGTESVMELAAATSARVVFVSTSGASGCSLDPEAAPDEDAPMCEDVVGSWPYYASKIEAERRARAMAEASGVELSSVRPPVMLGPGDHRFRSTGNIIKMLRGRLPFLIKGGISYVDIRDVASAMVRLMSLAKMRPVYHLPGTACSVEAFFRSVGQVASAPPPKIVLPYYAAHALAGLTKWGALRAGRDKSPLPDPVVVEMARHYWGLSSKYAAEELGFNPRDSVQTLADTVAWLRVNHPELRPD